MFMYQNEVRLPPFTRGYHIITEKVLMAIPELRTIKMGMLQVFIKHTSASLTINENADPTVRVDFENHLNKMVPEHATYYTHTMEGPDDATSHIKSSLMGCSVQVPISNGKLNLGTWQGIYLCEHRNSGSSRKLVVTAFGVG